MLTLRSVLYDKMSDFLPQYKGLELVARRSKALLVEDVYIAGLSVVNKLEEKRLKKILKGDISTEPTTSKEDKINLFEKNELHETCMELRER